MWRFIMGVGIGGDYPCVLLRQPPFLPNRDSPFSPLINSLSAVITSEFAATRIRGRMMTATFWSQGWGQFAAALVSIVCLSAFKKQILNDPVNYAQYAPPRSLPVHNETDPRSLLRSHIDFVWRLLIGLGAVPGAVALYFRLTLPETPRFTMDVERNIKQASTDVDAFLASGHYVHDSTPAHEVVVEAPKATLKDFCRHFGQWKNGKVLVRARLILSFSRTRLTPVFVQFGTAYSWFALDVAFYGLGLNSSIILSAIGYGSVSGSQYTPQEIRYHTLFNNSVGCASFFPRFAFDHHPS